MKFTSLNVLREQYLSFFETKGHLRLPSFPLVPKNDKSLLLINAGMAPLKPYFTGQLTPPRKRVTTCQKCIRTPDIERVGKTARHGTFFEMLGNFSFGDYFKPDAIPWAWEFLTKILEIPEELLSVTVYTDDDEAYNIWLKTGVPAERIYRFGKEENFWEIGSGPCGPCSEIYFDRGANRGCGKPDCAPGCECDRFIEIWNIVFTQFDGDGKGGYERLANPNIDTGMGLERLACIMQDVENLFEVDTIRNVMLKVCEMSGTEYHSSSSDTDVSLRVITDHIRGTTFMISDGVIPSNEGRGYVLRRLLRRAARHGRLLNIQGSFLAELCDTVINESKGAYPELEEKRSYIKKIIETEEERFRLTVDTGIALLEKLIAAAKESGETVLSSDDVFKLYDTCGFPIDLTREIASENGLTVDEEGFNALMKQQRERARSARSALANVSWSDNSSQFINEYAKTEFVGYGSFESEAEILCIISEDERVPACSNGKAVLLLDKTPFYAEGGGQVADTGIIETANGVFAVEDVKKTAEGRFLHIGSVKEGYIELGKCTAKIDADRRKAIMRNHSAAHMLQAALRSVLGTHIAQAGSYVDAERVRFDFTHFAAMTSEELTKVEEAVNDFILSGTAISSKEMPIEEAKKLGAIALFGEKYGDTVRVVQMGDYSTEFCGGTHLDNSAKAGLFHILGESSVAAGVRRIEATTGKNVLDCIYEADKLVDGIATAFKANNRNELPKRAAELTEEIKVLKKELEQLKLQTALSQIEASEKVGAFTLTVGKFNDMTADTLRAAIDTIKDKDPSAVCVFACICNGKLTFAAGCGKEAVKNGAHAGNILKKVSVITGGGGGGRPDSATSGGKDISKLDEALSAVKDILLGGK